MQWDEIDPQLGKITCSEQFVSELGINSLPEWTAVRLLGLLGVQICSIEKKKLKLKFQSKLDLCSGNHVVYRQTDGQTDRRTDKVNPVYPPSNFVGRGYKNEVESFTLLHKISFTNRMFFVICSHLNNTIVTKVLPYEFLIFKIKGKRPE